MSISWWCHLLVWSNEKLSKNSNQSINFLWIIPTIWMKTPLFPNTPIYFKFIWMLKCWSYRRLTPTSVSHSSYFYNFQMNGMQDWVFSLMFYYSKSSIFNCYTFIFQVSLISLQGLSGRNKVNGTVNYFLFKIMSRSPLLI